MINLNEILTDFEKIANEVKTNTGNINKNDFIARIVICYTDDDKSKKANEYSILQNITKQLNELNIEYKTKDNKYFYLLKNTDFENIDDFKKLQNMFCKKDKNNEFTAFTINLNNLKQYEKFIDLAINLLKNK